MNRSESQTCGLFLVLLLFGSAVLGDEPVPDGSIGSPAVATEQAPTNVVGGEAVAPPAVAADAYRVTESAASLETYEDTPIGFTTGGHPFRGAPDAPVVLVEYSDYLCPFCARHFSQTLPTLIEQYVKAGKMRLVFRDFPIAELHPTASRGAEAALCAGEQGPVLFWKMHDMLFRRQKEWKSLPDPSDFLADVAREIGAEPTAYGACMGEGRTATPVEQSISDARSLGFNGTPSFRFLRPADGAAYTLLGAQPAARFTEWSDALLAGQAPPEPKKPELPFWAKPEGLAPDSDRPGVTKAGDPYKGKPDAGLTVIEFSDFQCPSCGRHALETQPLVDAEFVETGKVMWVSKQFPLRTHAHARVAAVAAECAAEQARYWDMQHLLYEEQEQWSEGDPEANLAGLAETLGLDVAAFDRCFNSRQALERVLDDIDDAGGVVRSTPTFIFVYGGKGAVIRGAKKPEQFLSLMRQMYQSATAKSKPGDAEGDE